MFTRLILFQILICIFNFTAPSVQASFNCVSKLKIDAKGLSSMISSEGTTFSKEVMKKGFAPRGSAVATSSGKLAQNGIRNIIHAASGSMAMDGEEFVPTLESVALSVKNSLSLASKLNHQSIAIPFIGGKIFLQRIGVSSQTLASAIVDSIQAGKNELTVKLIAFSDEDYFLFKTIIQNKSITDIAVLQGSILDFKLHGCSAIINAANMEVIFGGGISGAIANATENEREINEEAQMIIHEFYLGSTKKK